MKADDDVLALLAKQGEAIWDKQFYKKKGPPIQSLKRLAEKGFVEVETRSCSTWNFGPQITWSAHGSAHAQSQYNAAYEARKQWSADNPRTLISRSEVYAKVTPRGIEEARTLGLLD